jgi:hypothetical protein
VRGETPWSAPSPWPRRPDTFGAGPDGRVQRARWSRAPQLAPLCPCLLPWSCVLRRRQTFGGADRPGADGPRRRQSSFSQWNRWSAASASPIHCLQSWCLRNQNLMNGSGVAAGDFDGDGLCDLYFPAINGTDILSIAIWATGVLRSTATAGFPAPACRPRGRCLPMSMVTADGEPAGVHPGRRCASFP